LSAAFDSNGSNQTDPCVERVDVKAGIAHTRVREPPNGSEDLEALEITLQVLHFLFGEILLIKEMEVGAVHMFTIALIKETSGEFELSTDESGGIDRELCVLQLLAQAVFRK